jgi:hypothetical protein
MDLQFMDEPLRVGHGLRIADCGLESSLAPLETRFRAAAQSSGVLGLVWVRFHGLVICRSFTKAARTHDTVNFNQSIHLVQPE